MTNAPKAIETVYKGFKFRSRLEARYAVYFDALGVKWEYEPEGYDLGQAGWYLPDFYFPQVRWHGEVKPDAPISKSDITKMEQFDNTPPKNSLGLLYLIGTPEILPRDTRVKNLTPGQQRTKHVAIRLNVYDNELIENAVAAFRSARFGNNENQSMVDEIDRALNVIGKFTKDEDCSAIIGKGRWEIINDDIFRQLTITACIEKLQAYSLSQPAEIHIVDGVATISASDDHLVKGNEVELFSVPPKLKGPEENPFKGNVPDWLKEQQG